MLLSCLLYCLLWASAAALALQAPPEMLLRQISICAGNVKVQQDPRYLTMLPFQAQKLPLEYCASWPIWVTNLGGKVPVARVPVPEANIEEWWTTWVPPAAFEQLWLPEDLPQPTARPAIGLVLSNGEPRYVFPTVDTTLVCPDGVVWRNRGLNSVPLGKTWLHYGEAPPENLRISAYVQPAAEAEDAQQDEVAPTEASPPPEWRPCLSHQPVQAALDEALEVLESLPPLLRKKLGQGFCYLVAPLPESEGLPAEALASGGRLRLFLSDIDDDPKNVVRVQDEWTAYLGGQPSGEDEWAWQRGECDLTVHTVPSGKGSPYLPKPYEALYQREWAS